MLSRSVALRVLVGLSGISCGCATDGTSNSMSDAFHQTVRAVTPHSSDGDNAGKATDDDWNEVGRQARADRPVEQENDPLRNLFVSPRAQEIERSLGVQ
jgi:hypothetical protein